MSISQLFFQDDFEQFLWTIVFLAMGGIALGEGVKSSGLLKVMDAIIRELVDGLSLYTVVLVLSVVVLVCLSFSRFKHEKK
jgi:phosphate transporter